MVRESWRALLVRWVATVVLCTVAACSAAAWPQESQPPPAFQLLRLEGNTYEVEQYTLEGRERKVVERAYAADFATLAVPENRRTPGGRQIELPVIRIRATGDDPAEPIFWLTGGPGRSNLDTFSSDFFIARHDHVMVGYRGVDGSVSLDCPEVADLLRKTDDVLTDATLQRVGDAYTACAQRLQQAGVDLNGYTVLDVVDDLESARRALGYDKIHLLAESYGTRLAYLYAVRYPESLHRVVLIGASPPGRLVWDPEKVDAKLRRYAELWAQDPEAHARTPDLAAAIQQVNRNMPGRWLFLPIYPGSVQTAAFALLAERDGAARVFDAYVAAFNGDASGLWLMSFSAPYIFPEIVNWGDSASKAVSADYEPGRDYAREQVPPHAILGAPLGRFMWGPAHRWPMERIPEKYRRVRPTDTEILILSGSLDPTTPAENAAQDLLPYLPNARQIVVSEMGHLNDIWRLQPHATAELIRSFFEAGQADDSLFEYEPMDFRVEWGFPLLAKLILAGGFLGTVVLVFLLWVFVRFLRRCATPTR